MLRKKLRKDLLRENILFSFRTSHYDRATAVTEDIHCCATHIQDPIHCNKIDRLVKEGLTIQDALDQVIPRWMEIHERTEMQLVDPAIPDLLNKLKKKRVSCIGLTKREPQISNKTLEQLDRLKIGFHATAALENEHTFDHLKGTLYKKGVIFVASGMDKGPSLLAYLKKLKKNALSDRSYR